MSLADLLRAVKERGGEPGIIPHLEKYLARRRAKPRISERPHMWHPSALVASDFCPRACMLARKLGVKEFEITNEKDRIFDVGHALHRMYQEDYLGPAGILWGGWRCSRCHSEMQGFMSQEPCPKCTWAPNGKGRWEFIEPRFEVGSHDISCRLDGLISTTPLGVPDTVWDLKTASKERFGPIVVSGPPERDAKQVTIYMKATGLRRAVITYACKNDGRIHDVQIAYDEDRIQEELADAALMKACLAEDRLPDRLDACYAEESARASKCAVCGPCFEKGEG